MGVMAPTQQHSVPAVEEDQLTWSTYWEPAAVDVNQITLYEDDNCHQVMMNVRDFMSSGVKVDVVDGNELVVEGRRCVAKREQCSTIMEEPEQSSTIMEEYDSCSSSMEEYEPGSSSMEVHDHDSSNVEVHDHDSSSVEVQDHDSSSVEVQDHDSSSVEVQDHDSSSVEVQDHDSSSVEVQDHDSSSVEEREQGTNVMDDRQKDLVSEYSFRRRISFPGLARIDTMTSTMSSDGILVVTLPKKKISAVL